MALPHELTASKSAFALQPESPMAESWCDSFHFILAKLTTSFGSVLIPIFIALPIYLCTYIDSLVGR